VTRNAIGQNDELRERQTSGGFKFNGPTAPMIKPLIVAAIALGLGPMLGSCGGASENGFSAYVADHWPHWAGGMPGDVPPRPGTPGYNEFIAHGQAEQAAPPPPAGAGKPAAVATTQAVAPVAAPALPAPQVAPPDDARSEDSSVRQGGLY
jgi:hypothetical protein